MVTTGHIFGNVEYIYIDTTAEVWHCKAMNRHKQKAVTFYMPEETIAKLREWSSNGRPMSWLIRRAIDDTFETYKAEYKDALKAQK